MIRGLIVIGTAVLCAGWGGESTSGDQLSRENSKDLERMQAAARISEYSYQQIGFLSNNIGPRLSGSPQAASAVAYMRQQMLELGLDVRLEPVTVRHWVRGKEEAQLIRYSGQAKGAGQKILVTALGNSVPTPEEGITASIAVVSNFTDLDQLPADQVEGKIVLFNYAFDGFAARAGRWEQAYSAAVRYRSEGPARAARKNAVAVLVRSAGSSGLRLPHTGVTRYEDDIRQIPAAAVPAEDADLIAALAKQGQVMIHLVLTPRDLAPAESYNVIADLKGAQHPEQIVLVSGHLD
jgi:carboxypeptidase Q